MAFYNEHRVVAGQTLERERMPGSNLGSGESCYCPKPGGGHVERPGQDQAATVTETKRGRLAGWKEYKEQAEIIRPQ